MYTQELFYLPEKGHSVKYILLTHLMYLSSKNLFGNMIITQKTQQNTAVVKKNIQMLD